ncbi:MAG: hypothetical protein KQH79_11140 [Bacteroidetes bacterium]|nr:hypothetical protein [Bacteroidota bacterium]
MKKQRENLLGKIKIQFSLLVVLLFTFSLIMVSCDDDDDNDDNSGTTQDQIAGTWIGFFDQVIAEGPNGQPCDAVFFDIDNAGNIKILSFLEGEQAAGHRGAYSIQDDGLLLSLTHDWSEESLDWVEAPFEATIYMALSSDGKVLTAGPSEDEAWATNKIELSNPDAAFLGTWVMDTYATLLISSPNTYEYEETNYSESGILNQFTYTDDYTYFFNKTTNNSSDGDCVEYFVGKVSLNAAGDEMTMWYGDESSVWTLQGGN